MSRDHPTIPSHSKPSPSFLGVLPSEPSSNPTLHDNWRGCHPHLPCTTLRSMQDSTLLQRPLRSHYCETKSPLMEDHPHTTCTADKQRIHSCRDGTIMAPLFPLSLLLLFDCSSSILSTRVTEEESELNLPYSNLCHLLDSPLPSP